MDRFEEGEQPEQGAEINFGGFGFHFAVSGGSNSNTRTLGYKFHESILPLERPVYLLGEVSDSSDTLLVHQPVEKGKKFIISTKSEEELLRSAGSAIQWLLIGGIGLDAIGLVLIAIGLIR